MAKITKYSCDIVGCSEEATRESISLPVTFLTEQTEGKAVMPYIDFKQIDLCEPHYLDFVFSNPLTANGAQGHNNYSLDIRLDRDSFDTVETNQKKKHNA